MTRPEMVKLAKELGLTTEKDVAAAGLQVLCKNEQWLAQRGPRITKAERLVAGLCWSEFLAENANDDTCLWAAGVDREWLLETLRLDWRQIYLLANPGATL